MSYDHCSPPMWGWPQPEGRSSLLPAPAGMVPRRASRWGPGVPAPRTRGDGPWLYVTDKTTGVCSPYPPGMIPLERSRTRTRISVLYDAVHVCIPWERRKITATNRRAALTRPSKACCRFRACSSGIAVPVDDASAGLGGAASRRGLHGGPNAVRRHRCCARGQADGEGREVGWVPGAVCSPARWRGVVLPPSQMREREQIAPPGRGGGGAAAAAMGLGPSSWSALSAPSWLRVRPRRRKGLGEQPKASLNQIGFAASKVGTRVSCAPRSPPEDNSAYRLKTTRRPTGGRTRDRPKGAAHRGALRGLGRGSGPVRRRQCFLPTSRPWLPPPVLGSSPSMRGLRQQSRTTGRCPSSPMTATASSGPAVASPALPRRVSSAPPASSPPLRRRRMPCRTVRRVRRAAPGGCSAWPGRRPAGPRPLPGVPGASSSSARFPQRLAFGDRSVGALLRFSE